MSDLLNENDATCKVKDMYEEIKSKFGMVPNFFQAQAAVDPEWLELNWEREKKIMLSEEFLIERQKRLLYLLPTFFVGNEMFWGNGRLEDALESALAHENVGSTHLEARKTTTC